MKERGISGSTLKIIAIVTMFLDHIGAVLVEPYLIHLMDQEITKQFYLFWWIDRGLRLIGRVAFPIFIFLLLEGFVHTRNRAKYARNLFVFALLAEIPFDLAVSASIVDIQYQSVMLTLLLGYCGIWSYDELKKRGYQTIVAFLPAAIATIAAHILHTDYGAFGVFIIVLLYYIGYEKKNLKLFYVCGVFSFLWEVTAPIAFLFIHFYNGKRGLQLKYIFYFFYPVHLLILGCIRIFILKY